ncbi:uncharacterized protein BDR25DRAFT_125318 [Lindgomyces ingoldianus]|uniref:Uncharacterized protein n=1 Tax=Lindgomyces ingoldianus TaxID=673940 RepID=A0ACB6R669_9PLEO|nr:uncharacterized protein BDR25DRAFT_125318 [Lindgomyces ingoldianus]KAF2473810.1 hypothetical protein BDR25DRAFT_125318 [Lindgomyces ingoldianus]
MSQVPGTPLRRSTRLSVARSVVTSVAETTATQSRAATNRRKGPLPKVQAQQSHAYGSAGRLATAQDLTVPNSGFAQAFGAQRDNAVARDEERPSGRGSSPASSSSIPIIVKQYARDSRSPARAPSRSPPLESNDEFEENANGSGIAGSASPSINSGSPTPSYVNTTKSFGMVHEAGMTAAPAVQLNGTPCALPHPIHDGNEDGNADTHPHKSYFFLLLMTFMLGCFAVGFLAIPGVPSINTTESSAISMLSAINYRIVYTWNGIKNAIMPQVDGGNTEPGVTYGYDLSHRVANVEKSLANLDGTLTRFSEYLPPAIVLRRNKKGHLEIPDEFWRALESKLNSEGLKNPTITSDVNWIDFLSKNQAKITQLIRHELNNDTRQSTLEIIQRKEFLDLLHLEYTKISDRVDRKIAEANKAFSKEAKTAARQIASKAFLDQIRFDALAYSNLVANAEISLRKVNFFSPGLGARVDPYKTSSTFVDSSSLQSSTYRRLLSLQIRRPPVSALEKWDEPGECWCAAPTDGKTGLAQLAVNLGQNMIPKQVTVEHLPKEASLDVGSAPKDMELWVETDVSVEDLGCSEGPKGWACLGKFKYNVHGSNHVQTFNLDIDLSAPVSKTLVRVTSTWGASYSCLYRLRLHGDRA